MKRRSFLGLLGATALTPIAAPATDGVFKFFARDPLVSVPTCMGRVYAEHLAAAMVETEQIIAGRVLDRAFNEIWWSYPDRSAVFEWLDHGAVLERPVDHWECAGHGDCRPIYYPSQGHTFDPEYARSLFPPAIEYEQRQVSLKAGYKALVNDRPRFMSTDLVRWIDDQT